MTAAALPPAVACEAAWEADFSPELQVLLTVARRQLQPIHVSRLDALLAAEIDWARLLALGHEHGLLPLLHHHLQGGAGRMPAPLAAPLREWRQAQVAYLLLLRHELTRVLTLLAEQGIAAIPYKGIALAEDLYGDAFLRTSGDLDLIVRRDQVPAVRSLLLAHGYRPTFQLSPRQEAAYIRSLHHYNVQHSVHDLTVEIHWDVANSRYNLPIDWDGIWRRARPSEVGGAPAYRLDAEDLFLLLCVHGAQHRWEELRWLADLAELMQGHPELGWSRLPARAAEWRIRRIFFLGLRLACGHLGVPAPLTPDGATAAEVDRLFAKVIDRWEAPLSSGLDPARLAFLAQMLDRPRDRIRYVGQTLLRLNFQDIEEGEPALYAYLRRPVRIVRKRGLRPLTEMLARVSRSLVK